MTTTTQASARWAVEPPGRVLEHRDDCLYLWDGPPGRGRLLGVQRLTDGIPAALAALGVDGTQKA